MEMEIDFRNLKDYVAIKDNGKAVKEWHTETIKYWFYVFFGKIDNTKIILETNSAEIRITKSFPPGEPVEYHKIRGSLCTVQILNSCC
jgi:hypothetical protein